MSVSEGLKLSPLSDKCTCYTLSRYAANFVRCFEWGLIPLSPLWHMGYMTSAVSLDRWCLRAGLTDRHCGSVFNNNINNIFEYTSKHVVFIGVLFIRVFNGTCATKTCLNLGWVHSSGFFWNHGTTIYVLVRKIAAIGVYLLPYRFYFCNCYYILISKNVWSDVKKLWSDLPARQIN